MNEVQVEVKTEEGKWIEEVLEQPGEVKAGKKYRTNGAMVTFGSVVFGDVVLVQSYEYEVVGRSVVPCGYCTPSRAAMLTRREQLRHLDNLGLVIS